MKKLVGLVVFVALCSVLISIPAAAAEVPYGGAYLVPKATTAPAIDGNLAEFTNSPTITLKNDLGTVGVYRLLWDDEALYVSAEVTDACLMEAGYEKDGNLWEDNSLEFMVDILNDRGPRFQADDYKIFVNVAGTILDQKSTDRLFNYEWPFVVVVNGTINNPADTDGGYVIEVKLPWAMFGLTQAPAAGTTMGYEFQMNDRDAAGVRTALPFNTPDKIHTNVPNNWGVLALVLN